MTNDTNSNFYRMRLQQEERCAEHAASPHIAGLHREMASHYRTIVERSGIVQIDRSPNEE
jgi:hypothetical protein